VGDNCVNLVKSLALSKLKKKKHGGTYIFFGIKVLLLVFKKLCHMLATQQFFLQLYIRFLATVLNFWKILWPHLYIAY
jgi:hypothetical protein